MQIFSNPHPQDPLTCIRIGQATFGSRDFKHNKNKRIQSNAIALDVYKRLIVTSKD